MNATPRQVIFGTGPIGLATLDALRRRGERVRLVNRSGTAPDPGWIAFEDFSEGGEAVILNDATGRGRDSSRRRRVLREPLWSIPATSGVGGPLRFDPTLGTAGEMSTPRRGQHLPTVPGGAVGPFELTSVP
jgi:hypothetical protein